MPADAPGGRAILVVDDEEDMVELLAAVLGDGFPGVSILTADSVMAATAIMAAEPVHLVVSDYHMVGSTGLDLLRHAQSLNPSPPFMLITAFSNSALEAAARQAGVDAYQKKPLDPAAFVEECRRLLERPSDCSGLRRARSNRAASSARQGATGN